MAQMFRQEKPAHRRDRPDTQSHRLLASSLRTKAHSYQCDLITARLVVLLCGGEE